MNFIKLQIGCLVLVLYLELIYIWQTTGKNAKVSCNPIFDALMMIVPSLIVFDGLTAWTVNHLEIVPVSLNLVLHAVFFILLSLFMLVMFLHTLSFIKGFPQKLIFRFLIFLPFIISVILILVFLPELEFIIGKKVNYSMGISVVVCYLVILLYFILIFVFTVRRIKYLEVRKRINVMSFLFISLLILISQVIFPEILISSLVPAFSLIALYINIEDPVLRRMRNYNSEIVTSFATLVESRDSSTGSHVKRTKSYVKIILDEIKTNSLYSSIMTKDFEDKMMNAAPMHDIGKISIPDTILQKPGKLTDEEYSVMKKHSVLGGEIIQEIFKDMDDKEFLNIAYDVTRYHHEKWNGNGYPEGLVGKEIPFSARIMAIADVFDAISAKRCYRDAMPLDKCFAIIKEGKGVDFDPVLTDLFLNAREKVEKVCKESQEG
ncbi:MAG: HD domain-containing protein [Spirochaetales bacterium]|nr:HD domain-containing protein [Spirochaetales bacterium]MDY5914730.1 HD domain-containing protein [Treponema sp.]